jgi:dTDP-4-dehydrorhamnose reductase
MKVLVFGASGMIGSAMFRVLSEERDWQVWGTVRSGDAKRFFSKPLAAKLLVGIDVSHPDALVRVFSVVQPDVVINCIGLTKHHKEANDPLLTIPVNSLLPHRMASLCALARARLIHVSTDCVFAGTTGNYVETDVADAVDVYGKSKSLGEVDYPNAITLRTSTIGHELQGAYGLLEWFLLQRDHCKGFSRAIFSGMTNIEFARVVRDVVIPRPELRGLYHLGGRSIGKYELLRMIAEVYGKSIDIIPDDQVVIDRSLDSSLFYRVTGYAAPDWSDLIQSMKASR